MVLNMARMRFGKNAATSDNAVGAWRCKLSVFVLRKGDPPSPKTLRRTGACCVTQNKAKRGKTVELKQLMFVRGVAAPR
jgi:hypothetical protein